MTKKLLNILFVGGIMLVLLAGLVRTLFFPKAINSYENRYADQVAPFSLGAFLDGSFQDSVDAALSDQVPFSQHCKHLYNLSLSTLQELLVLPIARTQPDQYINLFSTRLFNGTHMTYYTRTLSSMEDRLSATAESYNRLPAANPDTDFHLYFIEKDTDINFATGEKIGVYEYFRALLDWPEEQVARLQVDSFKEFSSWFYRTDHHWNHIGSYKGYLEVLELLDVSEPPLTPLETVDIPGTFSGSKATSSGAISFAEIFSAHRFQYPAMTITINGSAAEDYGNQNQFLDRTRSNATYSSFYGGDMGEIIFDTGTTSRGRLLVIGESYDNAILKLLASHFDQTYSVDMRYYKSYMGQEFVLSDYLAEHEIDQVLIIGNVDCFIMPEFRLEG